MSRHMCFLLAAFLSVAGCDQARSQDTMSQDTTNASPAAPAPSATTDDADDVTSLKAENAALKKEVSDAARTISELQAQLAQANASRPAATDSAAPVAASTNAAPLGPQRALPLDATNVFVAPAVPGAPGAPAVDAGPVRSYTVVKGDKLWTIARRMYPGHTKEGVEKIQDANKEALGTKPLKIGQVLVIPQ